jgi:hypothetical protein
MQMIGERAYVIAASAGSDAEPRADKAGRPDPLHDNSGRIAKS